MLEEEGITVAGECGDGKEAVSWLATHEADLVFLDIRMPQLDGFQVVEETPGDRLPPVVFVTAHDEFALRAFSIPAWDYLLKPFDAERLKESLARVRGRLDLEDRAQLTERLDEFLRGIVHRAPHLERLAVRKGRAQVTIRVADIDWIEAQSNYARLHLQKDSYLARTSLSNLEKKLDPRSFVRIHRSAIVNIHRIAKIEPCGHGDKLLTLKDGRQLNLSRRYREGFESVLATLS
jgi:two-component system LytT family response regulator